LRTPLCDPEHITARQDAIAAFLESPAGLRSVVEKLDNVCDIERIVGRLSVGRASPRDLAALGKCLKSLPELLDKLSALSQSNEIAPELCALRPFCEEQAKYLQGAIKSDPAPHLREG